MHVFVEAGDICAVGDLAVETEFVSNVKADQEAGGDARSETGNIDNGVAFVVDEAAPGGAKIDKHGRCLGLGIIKNAKEVNDWSIKYYGWVRGRRCSVAGQRVFGKMVYIVG